MEVLRAPDESTAGYWELLRVPDLSVGVYRIPAGGADEQEPHTEDEVYLVTRGAATLWTPHASAPAVVGSMLFVPAHEEHRFVDITDDFEAIVVFGPAEYARRARTLS
jgi:mannose-6-phosphate isomerase-like protein (cupin superfamily)